MYELFLFYEEEISQLCAKGGEQVILLSPIEYPKIYCQGVLCSGECIIPGAREECPPSNDRTVLNR